MVPEKRPIHVALLPIGSVSGDTLYPRTKPTMMYLHPMSGSASQSKTGSERADWICYARYRLRSISFRSSRCSKIWNLPTKTLKGSTGQYGEGKAEKTEGIAESKRSAKALINVSSAAYQHFSNKTVLSDLASKD